MTESTSSKTISTPDLYDQFPDQVEVLPPIFSNYGGISEFYGQIVTVKCFEDNSMVKKLVSQPGAGKVIVVDGGGSLRRALLGDMLAERAATNQWAGLIIYGCIRDVDQIKATPIGVQAVNRVPVPTERRGLGDIDIAIEIGGIKIRPGAFAYADNNGVLISTQELL